jgi:hypothetical protein
VVDLDNREHVVSGHFFKLATCVNQRWIICTSRERTLDRQFHEALHASPTLGSRAKIRAVDEDNFFVANVPLVSTSGFF